MAESVGIRINIDVPGLEAIRAKFQELPKNFAARYMASALRKAAEEGGTLQQLKQITPKGKTGNLRRSVAIKSKTYARTGVGIAIVGYKSGRKLNEPYDPTKLGYHQGLLEFGTKKRYRRSKTGELVSTGKMPVGGRLGKPPVRTAWERTRTTVEGKMVAALERAFENAVKDLAAQTRSLQGPF